MSKIKGINLFTIYTTGYAIPMAIAEQINVVVTLGGNPNLNNMIASILGIAPQKK